MRVKIIFSQKTRFMSAAHLSRGLIQVSKSFMKSSRHAKNTAVAKEKI